MQALKKNRKIALVSGGMGYVGKAVTQRFAQDGISVVVMYHTSSQESVDEFLMLLGEGHAAYQCDLGNEAQMQETIATIEREQGPVSIYVHAAGASPSRKPLHLTSTEEVLEAFKKNALSGFNFFTAGATYLKERKEGVMIGITTAAVVFPQSVGSLGPYVAAKYALQGMLASFRAELLPFGIRVYSVAPGFMEGGMNSVFPKAFVEMVKAKSPTKMLATAENIAEHISFLVSDAGKDFTDLTIVVAPELEVHAL